MRLDLSKRYALISVYYKNTPDFDRMVRAIHKAGFLIISTGGTAGHIKKLDIPVIDVSELTQFPEMMDGRVKTLHPVVFGGLLGREHNENDVAKMVEYFIPFIDIVVVNLYPFQEEVAKGAGTTHENIIEKIDVGGPSMLRAGAKNHVRVSVICDPNDYGPLAEMLESRTEITLLQRKKWWLKVHEVMVEYDTSIRDYARAHIAKKESVVGKGERPPVSDEQVTGDGDHRY